ncbi:diadenylate cyclase [Mycoplasmopsis cricetuli]|uniref:diadenylate cyclase n=1 Tax=Mycoplasmopsis cricetuli TaxID=171283 RepID=UPI000472DBCE|nr:DNA integrity scanning protein DisA nucleotide-binding domain protein [Mycoplasmopsis cricetuli]
MDIITFIIIIIILILVLCILYLLMFERIKELILKRIIKNKYRSLGKSSQIRLLYELYEAVYHFSKNKIGALITIENNENLDSLRTDGIILNSNISSSLLIAIFNKESPIHDGAVLIRDNKIYYAATFYKITRKSVDNNLGSRHRAALGISEQSDSITIVVSEENGSIRIVKSGVIHKVKIEDFRDELGKYLKG